MDPLPTRHADGPPASLPDGIGALPRTAVRIDADGRIREAGAMAAAMLGFPPEELQGRSLQDLAVEEWRAGWGADPCGPPLLRFASLFHGGRLAMMRRGKFCSISYQNMDNLHGHVDLV